MSHLYSVAKSGDQLCPLGFHPQVRWPTRCKRCFRDYKEHGGKRIGEDIAASTPSLSTQQFRARDGLDKTVRSWTSTQNLSSINDTETVTVPIRLRQRPSSWSSTPDLDESKQKTSTTSASSSSTSSSTTSQTVKKHTKPTEEISISVQLPARRRHTSTTYENVEATASVTLKRPPLPPSATTKATETKSAANDTKSFANEALEPIVINKTDSLAERVRKLQLMKRQSSLERESSRERSLPRTEPEEIKKVTITSTETEQPIRRRRQTDPLPPIPDEPTTVTLRSRPPKPPVPTPTPPTSTPSPASTVTLKPIPAPVSELKLRVRSQTMPELKPVVKLPTVAETKTVKLKTELKSIAEAKPSSSIHSKTTTTSTPSVSTSTSTLRTKPKTTSNSVQDNYNANQKDIQFLIQLKDSNKQEKTKEKQIPDDAMSTTTETTETTLIDRHDNELKEEIEMLKRELETTKARCERAEREKSDILLRRLASMDTTSNRTAAAEALKLQQKVNELKQQLEDLQDDKKFLSQKVKELTTDLETRPSKSVEEMLRNKLDQAERMCESLMDENEEMKRELKNMESEIDEMQDNFREEQADEYVSIKKELEQTTKNCRILSFKLKKSERKISELETEKKSLGNQSNTELVNKVKQLEDELKIANEVARRLQEENDGTSTEVKKKPPTLGKIGKSTSDGGKISRASLTRGGSQEDPVQLLRDLQDSMEREADLREQLKFAEEEAESLRKKSTRIEEENESLIMQLKKMATKARTGRKLSPNPPRRVNNPVEKDEGISDEEDPAELRLQLELNEQETAVLRRKVEELEKENDTTKHQIKDLHEKLSVKTKEVATAKKLAIIPKTTAKSDPINEKKIQVMEEEINELRKKLIEKDRDLERTQAEMSLTKTKTTKGTLIKAKSLETPVADQPSIDLKRQLQVVEQEASVLRTKTQTLEQENDKLLAEVKKLQLQVARGTTKPLSTVKDKEVEKLKTNIEELEKSRNELQEKLHRILEEPVDKLPARTPKKFSELSTKIHLKKIIDELEEEIMEWRAIVVRTDAHSLKQKEEEHTKTVQELNQFKKQFEEAQKEIQLLKSKKDSSALATTTKLKEVEEKLQKTEVDNKKLADKIKMTEEKLAKQESSLKQSDASKQLVEYQLKAEKDKLVKLEKELEKIKTERSRFESKVGTLDADLTSYKKTAEKTKQTLEKEIETLKTKSVNMEFPSKKLDELRDTNRELEDRLDGEAKRYSELNGRYELLEEEHVLFKAQLTTEKEKLESKINSLQNKIKDFEGLEAKWKKDNGDLNKRITELQKKLILAEHKDMKFGTSELEKTRLKTKLEEKESECSKLSKQIEMNEDQLSNIRRENDELKSKLDDFERIHKVHRTLSEHNATLENELKNLKMKLESSEMAVKSEVASTRLRYEQQVNTLSNELNSMQRQYERFKKDRDSYKQLLEAAQKNIGELKQNRKSYTSASSGDEDDKSKIQSLEQTVGCLEDELSEARLEASKLRTEMVSEKSAFEIRISEMTSKLNEYEEERILGSSKVTGTKTRLELSWQKEREEQQRLLQETSTLARDLRQTLFEVERERDKERLESKRKIDQIKKATEEELEEGRRKISELQSDLLELRDAHAKLRTANEKLRRDRDRYERERDTGIKRRLEQVGERKVGALLQTVDELVKIAPELQILSKPDGQPAQPQTTLSIPNKTSRSKSRSPSPSPPAISSTQLNTVLARLSEASDELRRYQRLCEEERDRDRNRRSMRRAASTENDNGSESGSTRPTSKLTRSTHGSLYRKSLSLDQSMQAEQQQMIWDKSDGSMSSMQSIDSEYGIRRGDSSIDSRLSAGSTQSDMPRTRKKKRGLMGKLRSLTKSGRGAESDVSQHGSDSDLSLAGDVKGSKKDLKGRLSGMFRRSTSRSNSTEKIVTDSLQRPISISSVASVASVGSNGSIQVVPPPAPMPNSSRGKPPTPTSQRKKKSTK